MADLAIAVREEGPDDLAAIRAVNDRAFDQPLEGQIVAALRRHGAIQLSLVAVVDDQIVGHILFSPVTCGAGAPARGGTHGGSTRAAATGCGRRADRGRARTDARAGCPFVVVLGHHEFYTRFGFVPAAAAAVWVRCGTCPTRRSGARARPAANRAATG